MKVRFNPFWQNVWAASKDLESAFVSSWVGAMTAVPTVYVLRHLVEAPLWAVFIGAVLAVVGLTLLGLYAVSGIEFGKEPPK